MKKRSREREVLEWYCWCQGNTDQWSSTIRHHRESEGPNEHWASQEQWSMLYCTWYTWTLSIGKQKCSVLLLGRKPITMLEKPWICYRICRSDMKFKASSWRLWIHIEEDMDNDIGEERI